MADEPQTPGGQQPAQGQAPADWYPDPEGRPGLRYWDGTRWTEHRHQPEPTAPPPAAWLPGQAEPAGQPGLPGQAPPPGQKTNGFAIASIVLGIIGGSILAIVFGLVARSQIRRSQGAQKGKGLATAGIALGTAWLALVAVVIALGASGVFDDKNTEKYKSGSEKDIATLVDRIERAFDDNEGALVCNTLFTKEWADLVGKGAGGSCVAYISNTDKNKKQADLKIKELTVNGDRATAKIDENGTDETWTFDRSTGTWRVAGISTS